MITEELKPGLHKGVPEEVYHSLDYASASRLKLMRQSPMHFRHAMDAPRTETDAFRFGRALHCAVLEPEAYESRFVTNATCGMEMKSGPRKGEACGAPAKLSDGNAYLCGRHAMDGFEPIANALSTDETETIGAMRQRIESHAIAAELLGGQGANEASIIWDDPDTGVRCKARNDRYTTFRGYRCHVDLKTTQDASHHGFRRECGKFAYHIQAAMYMDGADTIVKGPRIFVFIAIEKTPPYAIGVYQMDESSIEQGRRDYKRLLEIYKQCRDTDRWPDYTPEGLGWTGIPSYMLD